MRARATTLGALLVLAALALAACGGDDGSNASTASSSTTTSTVATTTTTVVTTTTAPPTTTAPGCRDSVCAVVVWLSNEGHGYAGDCPSTTPDQSPKWCSILAADGATQKVYAVGPVFSEIVKKLTVTESGGTWTVTNVESMQPLGGA